MLPASPPCSRRMEGSLSDGTQSAQLEKRRAEKEARTLERGFVWRAGQVMARVQLAKGLKGIKLAHELVECGRELSMLGTYVSEQNEDFLALAWSQLREAVLRCPRDPLGPKLKRALTMLKGR